MYDASFDTRAGDARHQWLLWLLRIAALAMVMAASAAAQMPGTPVLQNAWATPGVVGAVNFAGGPDGSTYGGAFSWAPGTARFQLSGGIGVRNRTGNGQGGVYGVRLAMPFSSASGSLGFAAFAGIGGGGSGKQTTPASGSSATDSSMSTAQVPVGVAIGWRRAMGGSRGVSVYATPNYVFFSGGAKSGGLMRAGVGADVGLTGSLGVTGGAEFGATRGRAAGGPSGVLYGVGVSYAFGRR